MGCNSSNSTDTTNFNDPPPRKVDPRLPFDSYRRLFNMKNSWKTVSRQLDATSKDCLLRFFNAHPDMKQLFPKLKDLPEDEDALLANDKFEEQAVAIFNVFDEVMEYLDGNVDAAIETLHRTGKLHSNIPGFEASFFEKMKQPFLEALRARFDDRFTDATEENLGNFYDFCKIHLQNGLGG